MPPFDISTIWHYSLRRGNTDHPANGACLFDAGMWLVYGKIGDNPPCSCPVIRHYAIRLNDSMSNTDRQRLKPFILRVVGNRDSEAAPARLRYIILETARQVVPLAFAETLPELAAEMRALPDDASYRAIRALMTRANAAAWAAGTAAAAEATDDAAGAAADAAADAAYAAASAAYAAAAYAAWDKAIAILDGALRIGKQSPEFDEAEIRRSVEAFELARIR